MAYLIMGSYQKWRKPDENLPSGYQLLQKWAVLRNMFSTSNGGQLSRELPASWDQGFILAFHPEQAKRRVYNYRTGHCVRGLRIGRPFGVSEHWHHFSCLP